MILDSQIQNEILGVDEDQTVAMTIDDSDKKILMMVLSQNLYSDPIGSIIREYTTNALDAQREAGVTDPIVVSLLKESEKFVFSVADQGVGLSPERIENVFSKYLASSKRDSTTQLGMYGLGSKSALSYTDSFTIISRYEGIEYQYLMFKGEGGTMLSLLDQKDTTERNGVTIKIFLKSDSDYDTFITKMQNQLCYFEGVYIKTYYDDIIDDYKIIKTDNWKYSELNQDSYLHLCLDNVYYPIDFERLGIEPIQMSIGLTFSLTEGITPTPNRESIIWSPAVKELILDRIRKVGNYFIEKWNIIAPNVTDLESATTLHKSYGQILIYEEFDISDNTRHEIYVKIDKKISKYCDLKMEPIKLSLFPNLDVTQLEKTSAFLLNDYRVVGTLDPNGYRAKLKNPPRVNTWDNRVLYLKLGEAPTTIQVQYLKYLGGYLNIVRKEHKTKLGKIRPSNTSLDNYYGLLQLAKHPKTEWRNIIKEYQALVQTYVDKWTTLDTIVPTPEFFKWKEENKTRVQRIKLGLEEVRIFMGRLPLTAAAKQEIIYESSIYKIKELSGSKSNRNFQRIHIYSTEDQELELNKFFNVGLPNKGFITAIVNPKVYAILKDLKLHNWIALENILTRRNKIIANVLENYIFKQVKNFANLYQKEYLLKLINKNFPSLFDKDYLHYNIPKRDMLTKLLDLYKNNQWIDLSLVKKTYDLIPKLDFIHYIEGQKYEDKQPQEVMKIVKLLWKENKNNKLEIPFSTNLHNLITELKNQT